MGMTTVTLSRPDRSPGSPGPWRGALALLLLALGSPGGALAGENYGQGAPAGETTPVSALLGDPGRFAGKTVTVKGLIVDVCAARGDWMEIAGDKPFTRLLVMAGEGLIAFPLSAKGKTATVRGRVEEVAGATACPDGAPPGLAPAGDPCANCPEARLAAGKKAVRIRATGAVIE